MCRWYCLFSNCCRASHRPCINRRSSADNPASYASQPTPSAAEKLALVSTEAAASTCVDSQPCSSIRREPLDPYPEPANTYWTTSPSMRSGWNFATICAITPPSDCPTSHTCSSNPSSRLATARASSAFVVNCS